MFSKPLILLLSLVLLTLLFFSSCENDTIHNNPEVSLRFSIDTLRFDTVFTELGSVTRFVKIYNDEEDAVILNNIEIENQSNSFFRMNVDGIEGNSNQVTRIEGLDSVYVFVEVTVDPNNPLSISPFVIEDKINIRANDSEYVVHLEAWGQNANYIPNRFSDGTINGLGCPGGMTTWDDSKPYVIYGVLGIDNCVLNIAPGTQIFVHGGIAISDDLGVYNDGIIVVTATGSINAQGTVDNPITIKTDRLEPSFQEVSGQWAGILLQPNSTGNNFKNTIIQHSIIGISIDSSASAQLDNCEIAFTSSNGITASHASVTANNCLFYENGGNGISLGYGGDYSFNYCTVANFNNQGAALNANNIRCTDPLCQEDIFEFPLNMTFNNCMLIGNDNDEISLLDSSNGEDPNLFRFQFNSSIVTVDELLEENQYPSFLKDCNECLTVTRSDTLFIDQNDFDYHLDSLSLAIDKGMTLPFISTDIEDNLRELGAEDVGCYEYQK